MRIAGNGRRLAGLFQECTDAPAAGGVDDAESRRVRDRNRESRHRDVSIRSAMEVHHLPDVHPVHVVGTEHGHQIGMMVVDEIEVLIDGIGGALKPLRSFAHLRRHDGNELVGKNRRERPGAVDMLDQRLRLVLHQQIDRVDAGVDQVRQHEIDDAIASPERHGRLRAFEGERRQPCAFASGQHHGQHAGSCGFLCVIRSGPRRRGHQRSSSSCAQPLPPRPKASARASTTPARTIRNAPRRMSPPSPIWSIAITMTKTRMV